MRYLEAKRSPLRPGSIGGINMKALLSGCVALAALAACGAAQAADPSMRGPAPYEWNGPFFGMSIGLGLGQSRHSAVFGDITPSFDVSGGFYGLALGYNWQAGTLLYGIDTDISVATVRGTSGYLGAPAGFTAETSERWLATYRGRIGYVRDSWMFYLTAGGATADVKIIATEPGAGIATENRTRWGWTAGVGVEAGRVHSFTVKAEYLFVDFGNVGYFNPPPSGFINRAGGVPVYDHIFRLGLNHKFPGSY
jgi:outer membrane immunogenic protein